MVNQFLQPFYNKGYSVTTDNFFTSYKTAHDLLKLKTKFFGTMKHNKKELPECAKVRKNPTYSSKAFEDKNGA